MDSVVASLQIAAKYLMEIHTADVEIDGELQRIAQRLLELARKLATRQEWRGR